MGRTPDPRSRLRRGRTVENLIRKEVLEEMRALVDQVAGSSAEVAPGWTAACYRIEKAIVDRMKGLEE